LEKPTQPKQPQNLKHSHPLANLKTPAFCLIYFFLLSCQPNTRVANRPLVVLWAAVAGEIREETAENHFVSFRLLLGKKDTHTHWLE